MRFQGKSIIVTGAGSGIGRATSKLFAAEGGQLVCADKTDAVHETVAGIVAAGGIARAIEMDAGIEDDRAVGKRRRRPVDGRRRSGRGLLLRRSDDESRRDEGCDNQQTDLHHDLLCFFDFLVGNLKTGGASGIAAPSCRGSDAPKCTPDPSLITACP